MGSLSCLTPEEDDFSMRSSSEKKRLYHFTPSQVVAVGFLAIILLGAFLLMLPCASTTGQVTPFLDALLTATSATCVTGLIVRDTGTYWSAFGQLILLLLIQVGGMGFISIALLINMLRGTKIGLRQRFIMQESAGLPQMAGILRTTGLIFRCMLLFEGGGALLLATQFIPRFGFFRGLWYAVFHSISAFCNAGFDLMGSVTPYSSMTGWVTNPIVNLVLMALIIVGGLGFAAWADVHEQRHHLHRYRLQTKLVLTTTVVLLVFPFVFFLLYEMRQPQWQGLSVGQKVWGALFQAVTPRTAGFNTLDYSAFSAPSLLLTIVLMLIGGSPGSTAGGIKTTTVAAIFLSVRATLLHKGSVGAYGRRLEEPTISRAAVLVFLYLSLFLVGGSAICILDGVSLSSALFESASAVGTVGLSLGLTPTLSAPSHLILIFLMYFGRIGGLTMIYALANPSRQSPAKMPQERVTIG